MTWLPHFASSYWYANLVFQVQTLKWNHIYCYSSMLHFSAIHSHFQIFQYWEKIHPAERIGLKSRIEEVIQIRLLSRYWQDEPSLAPGRGGNSCRGSELDKVLSSSRHEGTRKFYLLVIYEYFWNITPGFWSNNILMNSPSPYLSKSWVQHLFQLCQRGEISLPANKCSLREIDFPHFLSLCSESLFFCQPISEYED